MQRICWLLLTGAALIGGCGGMDDDQFLAQDRKSKGLTVILPGIEGESDYNHSIRAGILEAGGGQAIPIYHWGRPLPAIGMLLNQVDVIGNRVEAAKIAEMIVNYQKSFSGKPVYVIGHSGGGGMAVFVAEAMPEGSKIDGLVLLSASISAGYDLTKAISKTRSGIVNFYNPKDGVMLAIATTVAGNMDGGHSPAAGLNGFDRVAADDPAEKKAAYAKLYQMQISVSGAEDDGEHTKVTSPSYVSSSIAPWVKGGNWPAGKGYEVAFKPKGEPKKEPPPKAATSQPVKATAFVQPAKPTASTQPSKAVATTGPAKGTATSQPVNVAASTQPSGQAQPAQSGQPAQPAKVIQASGTSN